MSLTKIAPRAQGSRRPTPAASGQPDPRPLAEYSLSIANVSGNTVVTIALDQPCIIRTPRWAFIDCNNGARSYAPTMVVVDNRTFSFQFAGLLASGIGIIEVPYQDMQVQNFQGGFVRPGGQWFRKPS